MARPLTIVATLLVAVLVGCGGSDSEEDPAEPLSLQVSGDPEVLEIYRELAQAYEDEGGGTVELIETADSSEQIAKLNSSFAADRAPDVFLINHRYMAQYAERGLIEPAGPHLSEPGGLELEEFFPVATDAFVYGAELQCLPQNASSLVVYYNEDLFDEAGISPPEDEWTYDQFLETAEALTEGDRFGVAVDPSAIRAAPFIWGAGGEIVDDETDPTRLAVDSPEARRGLQALANLHELGYAPGRTEAEAQPALDRFLVGGTAMFLSSRRDVPALRTIEDFSWDVAPIPTLDEPVTVLHSDGFCISSGANPEAQEFVDFASGAEGQGLLAREGRSVPSLQEVARSDDFLGGNQPPASGEVFLDAIPQMRQLPTIPDWERIEESFDLAVEQAFFGELTVEEATAQLLDETEGLP